MSEITIRTLHSPDEMAYAVELQKVYWGENMADLVPHHMLMSLARYGGHLHAAFDGDAMVGLLIGFLGAEIRPGHPSDATSTLYVMSKRMVVLPQYRGRKIGEKLKQEQRQFALQHNIQLVLWTFDPLLSRNAYLNLHKLGAVVQHYEVDYFGQDTDNPVLSADRVQANWWVKHPRLSHRPSLNIGQIPIVNGVSMTEEGLLVPHEFRPDQGDILRLEIPIEIVPLERIDPHLGRRWCDYVRHAFTELLSRGYIAIDFQRIENRVFYIFTRDDGSFTFQ